MYRTRCARMDWYQFSPFNNYNLKMSNHFNYLTSALMVAAEKNLPDFVKLLLDRGALTEEKNFEEWYNFDHS